MIALNLGCGSDIRDGWINADSYPINDKVVKVDMNNDLPFDNEYFDYILVSHVLEHIIYFDRAWIEIHRILKKNGILDIVVPFGFNTDPFHIRYFNLKSIKRLTMYDGKKIVCGNEKDISYKLYGKPQIFLINPFYWYTQIFPLRIRSTRFPYAMYPFKEKELRFKLVKQ